MIDFAADCHILKSPILYPPTSDVSWPLNRTMATDFFERQSNARRNTRWLMIVFSLSVIAIVVTTFIVTTLAVGGHSAVHDQFGQSIDFGHFRPGADPFPWQVPIGASLGSLALIAGGSMFKIAQLSSGGTVVAERLGGRRVYPNTIDPVERRLLNVVEEMALASGVPVPPVFMLSATNRASTPSPPASRPAMPSSPSRAAPPSNSRATNCKASSPTSSATSSTATCGSICG